MVEGGIVAAAVASGVGIASMVLWTQAKRDVQAYLAAPPRAVPGILYSAPMVLNPGQQVSLRALGGDLLAAGYERVPTLEAPGQFTVSERGFEVWTPERRVGSETIPASREDIRINDGQVEVGTTVKLLPTVLATVGDLEGRRTDVALADLSPWVEKAVLAMEDARFREHHGIDPLGIARAVASNLLSGGNLQGGSTLTQQLAKNLFLTQERTLERKVREAFFAAALESELDKDELLELYLGEVYLGQMGGVPIHGVEQASRAWFGISASRLDLAQAATLAGVISAPNRYSPVRHPERARERRRLVLERMASLGVVSGTQAEAAGNIELALHGEPPGMVRRAPWAVDAAIDLAEQHLGPGALASSGYRIHTTIDPLLQRAAERAVESGMRELDQQYPRASGAQVALVAVRVRDGGVVAMVGGRDYKTSPFNRATNAWRQAGSTVKPLTLLAAFDADTSLSPLSTVVDEPITRRIDGRPWTPKNYDNAFLGTITLRTAIEGSRNIPAVKLAEDVGPAELQAFFRESGLSQATNLPSASLGAFSATPLEMAGAYTVFPGGGDRVEPQLIRAISDSGDSLVLENESRSASQVSARAAAMATSILEGVISSGTGRRAERYGVHQGAGGKTGTTDNYRDAWFVGFTPELVVAVWVGRDRGGSVGLSGSRAALPTWSRFVAASGTLGAAFPRPDGILSEPVCSESHLRARPACPTIYNETLSPEAVPGKRCDLHGGPLVELGRGLGDLFRTDRPAIEGEGDSPPTPPRKKRRRRNR